MKDFTIINLEECSSSNTYLKDRVDYYPSYTVIRCIKQTEGRGRWGRRWFSMKDKSLTFSILFDIREGEEYIYYPMVIVLSLIKLLENYSFNPFFLWPNDIYVNNRKLIGILNESITRGRKSFLISGIGINVNQEEEDFPEPIKDTAISLRMISGKIFDLEKILIEFLNKLSFYIKSRLTTDSIINVLKEYSLIRENEDIVVKLRDRTISGVFKGYTKDLKLKLLVEGTIVEFYNGDVLRVKNAGD